jgi:hypothetical protein
MRKRAMIGKYRSRLYLNLASEYIRLYYRLCYTGTSDVMDIQTFLQKAMSNELQD